jgi:hypothetical protein
MPEKPKALQNSGDQQEHPSSDRDVTKLVDCNAQSIMAFAENGEVSI